MTQNRRRTTPPPPDPLAALREPDAAGTPPPVVAEPGEGTGEGADQAHPLDTLVRATFLAVTNAGSDAEVMEHADAFLAILAAAQPLAEPVAREDSVSVVIAAWHADTTALGFLHKGGVCGCNYLARAALAGVLPVAGD